MIEVCNRRDQMNLPGYCDVYIGRPSVLGNPFVIGRDGDRDAVIKLYRDWLGNAIGRQWPGVMAELHRIAHAAHTVGTAVRLFCWCSPLACHGDVIAEVVQRYLDTGIWSVR